MMILIQVLLRFACFIRAGPVTTAASRPAQAHGAPDRGTGILGAAAALPPKR